MSDFPASADRSDANQPTWPPVPFDPELSAFLDVLPETILGSGGLTFDTIGERRAGMLLIENINTSDEELRADGFDVEHHTAPGPDGGPDIPLIIVRPAGVRTPLPVIYTMHGGGMIEGSHRQALGSHAKRWSRPLECAIVSVEYRLAPENPHPLPVEDCYAGLVWVAEHGAELRLDTDRVVVAGGSAGGGLAAAVALLCRDRGGPHLVGQLLICPMLDDRNNTPSAYQMKGLGLWDQDANQVGWTALLGDKCGGPDVSPYAAPARATDLSGLPPAFIDVGSAETFRDEAVDYASRIWRAGGSAELHVWPGGFHGFGMAAHTSLAQDAGPTPDKWLRRTLGK